MKNLQGRKWRVFASIAIIILLLGMFARYYWLDGVWGAVCELTLGRTMFVPGYSEHRYRRVVPGMTEAQVKATIGSPLRVRATNEPGEQIWFYTNPKVWDESGLGADCFYTERNIVIKNGVVKRKHFEFYFD